MDAVFLVKWPLFDPDWVIRHSKGSVNQRASTVNLAHLVKTSCCSAPSVVLTVL